MELPIQIKFFKKLELYQELKFQDRKSNKASDRLKKMWKTEKLILGWTARGHHLIAHPIDHDYVRNGGDLLKNKNKDNYDWGLSGTFGNLIKRGFAVEFTAGDTSNIIFTPEGLLMGEVIDDVENKKLGGWKYNFFYYLTWITALMGAFFIIINFFILLSSLFDRVFSLLLK